MADQEAKDRLRGLADKAANFAVDSNIPIRRYFRSGNEMIKMAEVYFSEDKLEAAYILYMKFMTLHVEKLVRHRDYQSVLPTERKSVKATVKDVMARTEQLKDVLRARFSAEHSVWLQEEAVRVAECARREEEGRLAREEEGARRAALAASVEKDRQVALWHQAQMDAEARGLPPPPPLTPSPLPPSSPPYQPQRPPYDPAVYEVEASAPSAPPPSYDRCVKPSSPLPSTSSPPPSYSSPLPSSSSSAPTFDRSAKPSAATQGLRTVVVPGDLIQAFLSVAKQNSNKGIETLGTLGGSLCQDRFVISHLVIPRQSGKSDSCTMEGLEDVWDVHDKENIIFLGWIHTHPEYDVFLSSVDMHNQYEWQHMLPEALAIVCSIKFGVNGFLSLTQAGLEEIGRCSQVNFHPHSKEPPLFEEAGHVQVEQDRRVVLRDLR